MSQEHDQGQDDVRRLLAAASSGPEVSEMPDHVAQRLDDVLAGLVSERTASEGTASERTASERTASERTASADGGRSDGTPAAGPVPPDEVVGVTQLASRRRRRWPRLLVAAAAVSVIGLGVGTVLDEGQLSVQSDRATSGAAQGGAVQGGAAEGGSGASADKPGSPLDSAEKTAPETQREGGDSLALADGSRPPRLRTGSLTQDVQRVADSSVPVPASGLRGGWRSCEQPRTASGDEWIPVRLDGEPAVLVLRAPAGGRRTADVFTCDDARTPAASATVDAR